MKSVSSVGVGLSVVFGCLVVALVGELYYLFWWKKRFVIEEGYSSPAREFVYMLCWKRASGVNPQQRITEPQGNKDLVLKPFGGDDIDGSSVESEVVRLHNLSGPPRFLFTIAEETKEELECDTPYLTPLASPSLFTPPLTPLHFNPLFESSTDAEFTRIVTSSPPPKFKFLQDAEEKLHRKKMVQQVRATDSDSEEGSFITVIVDASSTIHHPPHITTIQVQQSPT